MTTISALLEERGIKPSHQRIKVYEFLENNRIHPTVDEMYSMLLPALPTLSRTTIYNTVKLFVEKGLLDALTIEDNEIRYDINTASHAHFKCLVCGQVYDVPADLEALNEQVPFGFRIEKAHIYYRGVCPHCSGKPQ